MVSVVITTCMREPDILSRAVQSVLSQTYSDWELIIVDDSPDSYEYRIPNRNMIESIEDDRIRYIAHEVNSGACVARNTGLGIARGEYIAYLDDDDEWLADKLAMQVQKADEAGPEIAMIYCGWEVMEDKTGRIMPKKMEVHRGWVYDSLILNNYVGSTSYPLIRTECLRAIGGFDPLMQSVQDGDVWLRLAQKYQIDCVEQILVRYHRHEGERITTNVAKKIAGFERLNEKNMPYLEKHPKAYGIRHLKLALKYAQFGGVNRGRAIKTYLKAFAKCPWNVIPNTKYLIDILRTSWKK